MKLPNPIQTHRVQGTLKPYPGIKNIIAVGSGKGGVGKSTVAVNLALALHAEGATVGLLDADIYGPSQAQLLGSYEPPEFTEKKLNPVRRFGLQTMSIAYLIDQDKAMIWRGPMVSKALQQLLSDTDWQDLDYLIVDLPPGTGDIQLTLAQKIPVAGAVVVTTPQDLSLIDAKRAIAMFEKVSIPVLGIVENMSLHTCSQCGHQEAIFGENGGISIAEAHNIELLGQLPLNAHIRALSDAGTPIVADTPNAETSKIFREIALKLAIALSKRPKSYASKMPGVVVE